MTRLGIITSGGDCPGLNSVIRSVVRNATISHGWEVLGIPDATQGLMQRRGLTLTPHGLDFRGIDPTQVRVNAVAHRDVDEAVARGNGHGRLRAVFGER